jgi:hypothetical protein
MLIYDNFLMTFLGNVINMINLWQSQYFCHGTTSLDIRPIILWCFIRFITNRPIILWCFPHLSQINQPFVTFPKIHHGWRTNSWLRMDPPIVSSLHGMNISCWSHMPDWHRKTLFLNYRNIILCHLGGLHSISDWIEFFFSMKLKILKIGIEPTTPCSLEAYTTRILLQLCCCLSYYVFVLCYVYWFYLVSMVVGPTC